MERKESKNEENKIDAIKIKSESIVPSEII